jgi:nucleoside-diphosphate-sugar epimerase
MEPDSRAPFAGQVVLVTGARGFIGTHLVTALCRQGAMVHATSRARQAHTNEATWHVADLSAAGAAADLLRRTGPTLIFHLAGHVEGGRALAHVLPSLEANCLSTIRLLQAATEFGGCRVVLANSLEEPSADEGENAPCSPYAASKYASTIYARMFHELYGTPVTITRIAMGYGPGQWDVRKLVPHVILSLLRDRAPDLSSGDRRCDWIYIDDVVGGLLAAARAESCNGETIDLASGELTSLRSVVLTILDLLRTEVAPNFGALTDRPLERLRPADVEKSYRLAGWRPTTSLRDGLASTVQWYRTRFEAGGFDRDGDGLPHATGGTEG